MKRTDPSFSQDRQGDEDGEDTAKLQIMKIPATPGVLADIPLTPMVSAPDDIEDETPFEMRDTLELARLPEGVIYEDDELVEPGVSFNGAVSAGRRGTAGEQIQWRTAPNAQAASIKTRKMPGLNLSRDGRLPERPYKPLTRGRAALFAALLLIVVLNATALGSNQFTGAQGWAYVLGGPATANNPDLLNEINSSLHKHLTPGATARATARITPQQYVNLVVNGMTLDQKLGQMMIVQFTGPDYGLDISTMISQYNVGAVLIFSANDNIHDKNQLRGLISQMQSHSAPIPMAVAIDQEGGTVDRLVNLDGPRPSATTIGQSNDPNVATQEGIRDAKDLSSYGFNLNLAPVVDVNNTYNPQLYLRTFGDNPALVTKMAAAYLRGLQQSGKVLGTLKHFPGLGAVGADPHVSVPYLSRPQNQLEAIDWAPYRTLIGQGDVHAIMVTHEIVSQIDNKVPSSLSYKLVTGVLRNELGFQGVIMTDSLTMEGIIAYYSEAQAAALAVEAGSDLLMGATSVRSLANMIDGIKQAVNNGTISMQRIDDSVRRILMMKYAMGLLHTP
jgi:beta-N-acetylhexosaminidase